MNINQEQMDVWGSLGYLWKGAEKTYNFTVEHIPLSSIPFELAKCEYRLVQMDFFEMSFIFVDLFRKIFKWQEGNIFR